MAIKIATKSKNENVSLFSSDMVENRQTGIFKLMLLLLDKLVWFRKRLTNRKAFLSLHLKKLKKEIQRKQDGVEREERVEREGREKNEF